MALQRATCGEKHGELQTTTAMGVSERACRPNTDTLLVSAVGGGGSRLALNRSCCHLKPPGTMFWTNAITPPNAVCDEFTMAGSTSGTDEGRIETKPHCSAPIHDSIGDDAMAFAGMYVLLR